MNNFNSHINLSPADANVTNVALEFCFSSEHNTDVTVY